MRRPEPFAAVVFAVVCVLGGELPADHEVRPGPAPRIRHSGVEVDVLTDGLVEDIGVGSTPTTAEEALQPRPRRRRRESGPSDILDFMESGEGYLTGVVSSSGSRQLSEAVGPQASPEPGPVVPQGFKPVRLIGAHFYAPNPSERVVLTFDAPTNQAVQEPFAPCSMFIDQGLGTLGSNPSCEWTGMQELSAYTSHDATAFRGTIFGILPRAITPLGFPDDEWACDDDLLDEPVCGVGLGKIPANACGGKCAPPKLVDVMAIPETFGARLLSQKLATHVLPN